MNELKEVSWTEIQGNRFSRGLHQLMLKEKGYPITQKSRVIGAGKFGSEYVVINYDRNYVIAWLATKVIKPLCNCGTVGISNLLEEAWNYSGISTKPLPFTIDTEGKICDN